VTGFGGTPVRDAAHLRNKLALAVVGDVAEFEVMRDGGPLIIRAKLNERATFPARPSKPGRGS
jgi:S1-C subfamily serine protease